MRDYELMLITPVSLDKEHEDALTKKVTDLISKNKGKVTENKPLGKKKLAYPLQGQNEAIYSLVIFEGENQTVSELDRNLKISGEVLRHGIFKLEKKGASHGKS